MISDEGRYLCERRIPTNYYFVAKRTRSEPKKAAEELQVSQALLSHYEKGIRKCGLEFVVKLQTSITYPVITYWEDLQTVQVPPSQ